MKIHSNLLIMSLTTLLYFNLNVTSTLGKTLAPKTDSPEDHVRPPPTVKPNIDQSPFIKDLTDEQFSIIILNFYFNLNCDQKYTMISSKTHMEALNDDTFEYHDKLENDVVAMELESKQKEEDTAKEKYLLKFLGLELSDPFNSFGFNTSDAHKFIKENPFVDDVDSNTLTETKLSDVEKSLIAYKLSLIQFPYMNRQVCNHSQRKINESEKDSASEHDEL